MLDPVSAAIERFDAWDRPWTFAGDVARALVGDDLRRFEAAWSEAGDARHWCTGDLVGARPRRPSGRRSGTSGAERGRPARRRERAERQPHAGSGRREPTPVEGRLVLLLIAIEGQFVESNARADLRRRCGALRVRNLLVEASEPPSLVGARGATPREHGAEEHEKRAEAKASAEISGEPERDDAHRRKDERCPLGSLREVDAPLLLGDERRPLRPELVDGRALRPKRFQLRLEHDDACVRRRELVSVPVAIVHVERCYRELCGQFGLTPARANGTARRRRPSRGARAARRRAR
jgi:hypothetical protein